MKKIFNWLFGEKTVNEQLRDMGDGDGCSFQPELMKDVPVGMFHCKVCGEMVVAGVNHP